MFGPLTVGTVIPHIDCSWQMQLRHCQSCGVACTKQCGDCHRVFYCSRHCQQSDHELHRILCPYLTHPLPKTTLIPEAHSLATVAEQYGIGIKGATWERSLAIVLAGVLYGRLVGGDPPPTSLSDLANHAVLYRDPLVLRFCLQSKVRSMQANPLILSRFSRPIVQTLIDMRWPLSGTPDGGMSLADTITSFGFCLGMGAMQRY